MSRQTPRKQRGHNRHQSHSGPRLTAASDYESDAAHYMDSHPAPNPALLNRTNTDLNLSVLRRYLPSINSIISIAANAVVYTFAADTPTWDKTGIEGTYFLCMQDPAPGTSVPRACIFILNRRGLENVILDLSKVAKFEVMDEIYIFQLVMGLPMSGEEGEGEDAAPKVIGIWIHADEQDTRVYNSSLIQEMWALAQVEDGAVTAPEEVEGPALQAIGKKLSLSDLFGTRNGAQG